MCIHIYIYIYIVVVGRPGPPPEAAGWGQRWCLARPGPPLRDFPLGMDLHLEYIFLCKGLPLMRDFPL